MAWRRDYEELQAEMFTSMPPTFDEILATDRAFETEFNALAAPPDAAR